MGIRFAFINDGATIEHLNVRKQGDADNKILALDIKLHGTVTAGRWLDQLFGTVFDGEKPDYDAPNLTEHLDQISFNLDKTLWKLDKDRNVRLRQVAEFKSASKFEGHYLQYAGLELTGDLKNFVIKPLAGALAELTFSFSVTDPETRVINVLAVKLKEPGQCSVIAPPDLFDDAGLDATETTRDTECGQSIFNDEPQDPLFVKAINTVKEHNRASTSFLQRHLRIGYNRANKIIQDMEQVGIISPPDKDRARKIFISDAEKSLAFSAETPNEIEA